MQPRTAGGVGRRESEHNGRQGRHARGPPRESGAAEYAKMPGHFNAPRSARMADNEQNYRSWMCLICGFVYDEAAGLPEEGLPPGTRWEDVPINWTCPECGARKEDFEMVQI